METAGSVPAITSRTTSISDVVQISIDCVTLPKNGMEEITASNQNRRIAQHSETRRSLAESIDVQCSISHLYFA
jgi:hypothetical protein